MSKVIAIMNKPEDCQKCVFGICKYSLPLSTYRKGYCCQLKDPKDRVVEDFDYDEAVHLSNCPLREIPSKKEGLNGIGTTEGMEYNNGYNDCIDKILGGAE